MRFQLRQPAGDHKRFAATAFDSQIGESTKIIVNKQPVSTAQLVAAEVIEDGRAALLTYESDSEVVAILRDAPHLLAHTGPGLSFRTIPVERGHQE